MARSAPLSLCSFCGTAKADVKKLIAVEDEGIMGVITGRAIYEGSLDFAKARALAEQSAA